MHSPMDYFSKRPSAINQSILQLIRDEYKRCGTRYFGLGNLNKMKSLNDGGIVIAKMVS